jgi:phage gpG-like protein
MSLSLDSDRVEFALSRFGRDVEDWRPFWKEWFAPRFFSDVQENFDREGAKQGARWVPLSPAYKAWKDRKFPGRKILERSYALRQSLTWSGSGLGPRGVFRPRADSLELGTSVRYGIFHQRGAIGSYRRAASYTRRGRARVVGGGGLPQRRFLFLMTAGVYARLMQQWLVGLRAASGLGNRYGSTGVAGSGGAFTS